MNIWDSMFQLGNTLDLSSCITCCFHFCCCLDAKVEVCAYAPSVKRTKSFGAAVQACKIAKSACQDKDTLVYA